MRTPILASRVGMLAVALTALSAAADRQMKPGELQTYKVEAGDVIFKGALCMVDTDGYLLEAADTASCTFCGVADESVSNSGAADGAASIRVRQTGTFLFAMASATQAAVGKKAYAVDDNTVALAATTTNDVWVGDIVALESASSVWVRIDRAVGG